MHSPLLYDVDDLLINDGLEFSGEENRLFRGFVDAREIVRLKVIGRTTTPDWKMTKMVTRIDQDFSNSSIFPSFVA